MILLNDFRRQWEDVREDCHRALERTGSSGWYILGEEVRRFEQRLAALWGVREAVGVASGLDALEAALRGLGLLPGERVLTAPVSAFATALAVVRAGGVPVFAPCDPSGLADLEACEQLLARDAGIRFFVPVHLYGHCLDMERLDRIGAGAGCGSWRTARSPSWRAGAGAPAARRARRRR